MLKPLKPDFTLQRYGITVRLATEADAEYIMSLRTNKELTKFIHKTEDNIQKHLDWFKKYKIRESEGRDYYFLYLKNGKPVGVNRVYNVFEYYGTPGSWLCSPDNDIEVSMATNFILNDIIFEFLCLDFTVFDVRKGNKHVWKLHKQCGAKQIGESEIDYYFVTFKQDYLCKRDGLLDVLNLK